MQQEARPWQVRQTALRVDLGLLRKNYYQLLKRTQKAELLILLKSDAYGHSHQEISKFLDALPEDSRLHGFGVANVEEGIELRREGIRRRIYVFSGIQQYDEDLDRCLETCNLIPVISSIPVLESMAEVLEKRSCKRKIHLKLNTGMNRLGIDQKEIPAALEILRSNKNIILDGLLSHYAQSEKPKSLLTKMQTRNFIAGSKVFSELSPPYKHMENSMGLANHCYSGGNISRVGLHIFGLGDRSLSPIAEWSAQIYQIRELNKGDKVGYGATYIAKRKMRMAILGVGYGDGYRRALSNKADVLIKGKRCKVIGSVSMDLTAVDISSVPSATIEDRAILIGRDGKDEITATELAKHAQTIPWEIMTAISPRVPRFFFNGTN